jgi:hypothetical protein
LIAATILTLTFLPALYALAFRVAMPDRYGMKSDHEDSSASDAKQALPAAA